MQSSLLHLSLGLFVCILCYLGMYWVFDQSDLFAMVLAGTLGSIGPDLDKLRRDKDIHRHFLFHSSFFVVLGFIYAIFFNNARYADVIYLAIGFMTHLFSDLKPGKEGKKLGYLIYKRSGDRMSADNTDLYLITNSVICFTIAIFCMAFSW